MTYAGNGQTTRTSAGSTIYRYGLFGLASETTRSVTPPGGSASAMAYLGNGQSERSAAGTTTFVTNLLGLSSETTAGQTTRYIRDPSGNLLGERTPSGTFYYLVDALGSVLGLTNASGQLVSTYTYDPYGNLVASTGSAPNPWRFAGGYLDQRPASTSSASATTTPPRAGGPSPTRSREAPPIPRPSTPTSTRRTTRSTSPTRPARLLVTGGSGGRWTPKWTPRWTPRWTPKFTPKWQPRPMLPSSHRLSTGSSFPPGGGAGQTAAPSSSVGGCLGAIGFGGQAGAAGGEAVGLGAEAFAGGSVAAGLAMTGVGLGILALAAAVIVIACR